MSKKLVLAVSLLGIGLSLHSMRATAAVKYSFTQLIGTGNQLVGALSPNGSLSNGLTPVRFDITLANALPNDAFTGISLPGLTYNGTTYSSMAVALDFTITAGTSISAFTLSQFLADFPGSANVYKGRITLRTDSTGGIIQYNVNVNGQSSYTGPLTAGFTAPTTYNFTADSANSLSDSRLLINVSNTSNPPTGPTDFGDLICTAGGQGCGGSFALTTVGGTGGTGGTGGSGGTPMTGVPEPASALLLALGLTGIAAVRRRR